MNLLFMNFLDKLCWCLFKDFEVLKLRVRMVDRMYLLYFFISFNYVCFGNSDLFYVIGLYLNGIIK